MKRPINELYSNLSEVKVDKVNRKIENNKLIEETIYTNKVKEYDLEKIEVKLNHLNDIKNHCIANINKQQEMLNNCNDEIEILDGYIKQLRKNKE